MSAAQAEQLSADRRGGERRLTERRSTQAEPLATEQRSAERRTPADRRKYNKRVASDQTSPPFADVLDRIASALEGIEGLLSELVEPREPHRRVERD